MRVLVFDIDGNRYGLDAGHVLEVLPAATLSPVPKAPPAIKGILDVHGRVVPIVDTRRALGIESREVRQSDHLIVVHTTGRIVGLHVDHAVEIVEIDDASAAASDGMFERTLGAQCIARVEGGLLPVQLLDAIVGDLGTTALTSVETPAAGSGSQNVPDA
jgi:purine-binding chemotaxis protein CheW